MSNLGPNAINTTYPGLPATGPTPHIPQTPCVIVTVTQAGT